MYLTIQIFILIFLLFFVFWLVSNIISMMTKAPYVVTSQDAIETALKLADPKPSDLIYDLGCGDARVLITATKKYRIKGAGWDISPFCVWKSRFKIRLNCLQDKIRIEHQSMLRADLSKPDIIFLYTGTELMSLLEKNIFRQIKKTTRIVSVAFPFQSHKPVKTIGSRQLGKTVNIYLYTK